MGYGSERWLTKAAVERRVRSGLLIAASFVWFAAMLLAAANCQADGLA